MIATISKRMQFARALAFRPFAFVWIGQTLSRVGDGIFNVALAWQVLLMTHSAAAMGFVILASVIPRLVFILFGGVAADRLPRRLIILTSDGGRGLLVLLISILGFTGHLPFSLLVVEAVIFGVADGFFNPAIRAIVPDLVEKEALTSANALTSLGSTASNLAGPVLGALLIVTVTPMGAFAANALSFFLSVAFLLPVPIAERHVQAKTENIGMAPALVAEAIDPAESRAEVAMVAADVPQEQAKKRGGMVGVLIDVWEGMTYVSKLRWLLVGILSATLGNIGLVTTVTVAVPKLVSDTYHQGPWLFGTMNAFSGIGVVLGLVLVGQATKLKRRGLLAYGALIVSCLGTFTLGLPFPYTAAVVIAPLASIFIGFGLSSFNTLWYTLLQEKVPGDKLGRVFSFDELGSFIMIPLGAAVGGVLTDALGPAKIYLTFGLINLILAIIPLLVREMRALE